MFSEKLEKALEQYKTVFGDYFPTVPLAVSRAEDEVIQIIHECLKQGKDVYELGYISDDSDILY